MPTWSWHVERPSSGNTPSFLPREVQSTERDSRIYVAGHSGLVGSALVRRLEYSGHKNIIVRSSRELDLTNTAAVDAFFEAEHPEYVLLAAAKVGGILANSTYPAEFLRTNLLIAANVIHAAHVAKVKKLLYLGSSCIYPREAPQPIREEYLLTGPLERTNEAYAVAKIAGVKMCQSYRRQFGDMFISVMPTNLYGPGDNFHDENGHVIPSLLLRFHHAKERHEPQVTIWGTGTPRREFLYADDLADACVVAMDAYEGEEPLNIGTGKDITISELAATIAEVVDYKGEVIYDTTKPDGTPRKVLDVSRLSALGWTAPTSLREGLRMTYRWLVQQLAVTHSVRGFDA